MATQTMAEAALFINDEIVRGVAEDIITLNPIYSFLPFDPYTGQAILVNRELTLGGADYFDVGDTISAGAKAPATYTQQPFSAIKIIGDAEMDNLVQATSSSDGVDMLAVEISSKAKHVGRKFQEGMATGDGVAPNMNSFHSLIDATQYTASSLGQSLGFDLLDELCDLVKSKDGEVDFLMMPARTLRSLKALYRGMNAAAPTDVLEMPDGTTRTIYKYEDIPVFKNEYLSVEETADGATLTGGALTSVWAGVFDDGSRKVGIAGIYPASVPMGIQVHPVGTKEDQDEEIWRVKQYTNFVVYNRKGLARLPSIDN